MMQSSMKVVGRMVVAAARVMIQAIDKWAAKQ